MIASNLVELFREQTNKNRDKVLFEYKLRRNEPYRSISWGRFNTIVMEVAYGLIELGLRKGDKVAILSDTRYEWAVCDIAVLSTGGIVVPIYPTLPEDTVAYILNNSCCQIVFVEDKGQLQKIRSKWDELLLVKYAIVIEDLGDIPRHDERIINLNSVKDRGKLNFFKDPYLLNKQLENVNENDIATIIYTSGTTGDPKGVMLTHGNILSILNSLSGLLPVKSNDKFLSFLPLSHVFERVGGLHYAISTASTICYCSSVDQIGQSLKDSEATLMLVVPRILEKIYSKINAGLKVMPEYKKKLFNFAFSIGKKVLKAKNEKKIFLPFVLFDLILYRIADIVVFSSLRKKLAPKLKYFISGGAPLSKEIADFFFIIGIPVLEGYGLTETSAPVTVNTLKYFRSGTVGKSLPNTQIKIADDGEILIRGPSVFVGYYNDEKATKQAFSDSWFSSGDIGVIDEDGFLKITDRKKDIIVSSSGKNISPQNIENALRKSPYISNVVVIGDKKKYLSALITLESANVLDFALQNNIPCKEGIKDLYKDPKIIKLINEEVKFHTAGFADYEQIVKSTILPEDFTVESGEITPTLKVKRKFVYEKYKYLIDSMYPEE